MQLTLHKKGLSIQKDYIDASVKQYTNIKKYRKCISKIRDIIVYKVEL